MTGKKDNGKGKEEVIEFEELDLESSEEEKEGSNKITELKDFLKENLEPDKYAESMKILGIDEAMTNEELLESLTLLLKKKPEEEEEKEDEEEDEEEKKKKAAELEEKGEEKKDEAPDRKEFLEKCMKEGKSMTECNEEYKEKYPAPKEDEEEKKKKAADDDDEEKELTLPEDVRKELDELKLEMARLKDERRLSDITHKVDEQIAEKHLAPVQKPQVIKLMQKLPDDMHEDFLGTFANVKFRGFEDIGHTRGKRPGEPEKLDEELRVKLLKEYGIDELILERGIRKAAN